MKRKKNSAFEKLYQERGVASQRQYPNEQLIAFIARNYYRTLSRSSVRILEVGCGSGANLWYLSREGFDVYGTDHSKTGLRCAEQLLARWDAKARLALCDMTEIPFDGRFDAIVDVVSMQH